MFEYLVCLVIILWVIFGNLWFLIILESAYKLIHPKFFSPFLTSNEPGYISLFRKI